MIGCPLAAACLDACRFGESSQQATWPHDMQIRRWTQRPPIARQSSQPATESGGSILIWSRCSQTAIALLAKQARQGGRRIWSDRLEAMPGAPRRTILALALLGLAALPSAAAAAPAIPAPNAPQNPFMAPNPDNNIHDDTWMTDAYRRGGPTGSSPATSLGALPPSLCGSITFDGEGRIVTVCPSVVAPPELRLIDPQTLEVLASYTLPAGLA